MELGMQLSCIVLWLALQIPWTAHGFPNTQNGRPPTTSLGINPNINVVLPDDRPTFARHQSRPENLPPNLFSQPLTTVSSSSLQPIRPGITVPRLLPFTQQEAFPQRTYTTTLHVGRPIPDREVANDVNRRIPKFLIGQVRVPKQSRDLSMDDAQYIMVMSKPQRPPENMQDYALLDSAENLEPSLGQTTELPGRHRSQPPRIAVTIPPELDQLSFAPTETSQKELKISSTTSSPPTLELADAIRVTKAPRRKKNKKMPARKSSLSAHREYKRSPQHPDLSYVPSFRRRQVTVNSRRYPTSLHSGNPYTSSPHSKYPTSLVQEVLPNQYSNGNSLIGYGLQYPSIPVAILPYGPNHTPALYGGQMSHIPIPYQVPMFAPAILPAQPYGLQSLGLLPHNRPGSPLYRTPDYQMPAVQPVLTPLGYVPGSQMAPSFPNYQTFPATTPLVTSHPAYQSYNYLPLYPSHVPLYEPTILRNGTQHSGNSEEVDSFNTYTERQQSGESGQGSSTRSGNPVFMKHRPIPMSYAQAVGILTQLQGNMNLPPIYRPPDTGSDNGYTVIPEGFTKIAYLPPRNLFQSGSILPVPEPPSVNSDSGSQEQTEKPSVEDDNGKTTNAKAISTVTPRPTSDEQLSSERGRRLAIIPQTTSGAPRNSQLAQSEDKKRAGPKISIEAQERSDRAPAPPRQFSKTPRKTPVLAYFFPRGSVNVKPSSRSSSSNPDNKIYGFLINDPIFLAYLKARPPRNRLPNIVKTFKKQTPSTYCTTLFGDFIPNCNFQHHSSKPKRKKTRKQKSKPEAKLDILKGGVFTPTKPILSSRISHVVPQVMHPSYFPMLPPDTVPLAHVEQALLARSQQAWRPILHVPISVKRRVPVYNRSQFPALQHLGISPHGHPAFTSPFGPPVFPVLKNGKNPIGPTLGFNQNHQLQNGPKHILSIPFT